jgi:MFS superfamily sulfate permease-like transporter
MRGFISGLAVVIFIEQLIPELGLEDLAVHDGVTHESAWGKIKYILSKPQCTHRLTFAISVVAFFSLLTTRFVSFLPNSRFDISRIIFRND